MFLSVWAHLCWYFWKGREWQSDYYQYKDVEIFIQEPPRSSSDARILLLLNGSCGRLKTLKQIEIHARKHIRTHTKVIRLSLVLDLSLLSPNLILPCWSHLILMILSSSFYHLYIDFFWFWLKLFHHVTVSSVLVFPGFFYFLFFLFPISIFHFISSPFFVSPLEG